MQFTDPRAEQYIRGLLARHDDPVLLEMEREAETTGFPAVGRMVGVVLEILARGIGARRVFEMGSGFGYSGYWFARAVGSDGEVHLTDGKAENRTKALDFLGRAGLGDPVRFHVGDALEAFSAVAGDFDVVFVDIDKIGYPAAWEAARDRIRRGGLYIADNTLGFGAGNVVDPASSERRDWAEAVRRHTDAVTADQRYLASILPIREGVLVALRTR